MSRDSPRVLRTRRPAEPRNRGGPVGGVKSWAIEDEAFECGPSPIDDLRIVHPIIVAHGIDRFVLSVSQRDRIPAVVQSEILPDDCDDSLTSKRREAGEKECVGCDDGEAAGRDRPSLLFRIGDDDGTAAPIFDLPAAERDGAVIEVVDLDVFRSGVPADRQRIGHDLGDDESVGRRLASDDDTPYYPIRLVDEKALLSDYVRAAEDLEGVTFVGRLGTYRYLDMDVCIREALDAAAAYLEARKKGGTLPAFMSSPL